MHEAFAASRRHFRRPPDLSSIDSSPTRSYGRTPGPFAADEVRSSLSTGTRNGSRAVRSALSSAGLLVQKKKLPRVGCL